MIFTDIGSDLKEKYNKSVYHPLQSFEWGESRKKTGINVLRRGVVGKNLPTDRQGEILNPYEITIHQTPGFPYFIGYFPKGEIPSKELLDELKETGEKNKLSFIQLEPNVVNGQWSIVNGRLHPSFHPLFTKYTFILDLTKTEDELLKNMHQKTRYNIRVAQKHGVEVLIDNSDEAFKKYLKLTKETTKRQKFYAHDEKYHRLMWETLKSGKKFDSNKLQAHLLTANYKRKILVTYVLFTFKDTLYYPYGASSDENREVMASPKAMWEAIRFGKNLGLSKFDMWGAANVPNPKSDDPYFGFHRFKEGFGANLIEFVGSYDLVINPLNYRLLTVADKIRWAYLKAKKRS
ncbi:MAG: peptidoglycan bridge formation glycyltransferase FemA/FemB family protein [Candidatus Levybacteria bacterium]|nr:peptidoglycan bridge formation glycyltransferase FemA/FemB family protein [Candidatus Levybacteria bacterium]